MSLVADQALTLEIAPRLLPLVARWLPRHLEAPSPDVTPRATIRVDVTTAAEPRPGGSAILALGPVQAWVDPKQELFRLAGATATSTGVVDLAARGATLLADPAAGSSVADLFSMLTLASALLLAGLARALVHAAGVVAPEGGGWLLVGDARAGKSTTCANLVRAGWSYLSDDQVVLGSGPTTAVAVEGWLRPFHLDQGWAQREAWGVRSEVPPTALGPGSWRRSAPLAGLLFPAVRPTGATALIPLSAGEALAALVRQSPWLLACRRTAPAGLALLQNAVEHTASYRLELGADTYRDGARLGACLESLPAMS